MTSTEAHAALRHATDRPDGPPTRRACDFVDARLATSRGWTVIHDLGLLVDGRALRIDHLLIDDTLDIVLLDTRFIDSALYLFEHGRCESFDGVERRLVASPLPRMARDMRTLGEAVRSVEIPRGRLRERARPTLRGGVLIDPAFRLGASSDDVHGRIGIYPREAFFRALAKRRRRRSRGAPERLSMAALATFADALLARHSPRAPLEPSLPARA